MAYQVSNLVTLIRKRAKDLTLDESLLIEFISEVNHSVLTHNRLKFMEQDSEDSVSTGGTSFDIDDDVDTILSLKLFEINSSNDGSSPTYVHYNEFINMYDPDSASHGTPTCYTLFNNTVYFNIPANKTYSIKYKYLQAATLLTALTDVPNIPERFKEIIVRGALAMVEEYRDNFDIASVHERKMEDKVEDMVSRLSIRQLQKAPKAKFGNSRNGFGMSRGM